MEEADEFDAIEKLEQLGVNRGAQLRLFRYRCMQPWQLLHELTAVQQSSAWLGIVGLQLRCRNQLANSGFRVHRRRHQESQGCRFPHLPGPHDEHQEGARTAAQQLFSCVWSSQERRVNCQRAFWRCRRCRRSGDCRRPRSRSCWRRPRRCVPPWGGSLPWRSSARSVPLGLCLQRHGALLLRPRQMCCHAIVHTRFTRQQHLQVCRQSSLSLCSGLAARRLDEPMTMC